MSEALKMAEQWKGRDDDAGRLSRAVIAETLRSASADKNPPGYRTGSRKLVYNKDTKQIDVVDSASGFVVDSFDPPQEAM